MPPPNNRNQQCGKLAYQREGDNHPQIIYLFQPIKEKSRGRDNRCLGSMTHNQTARTRGLWSANVISSNAQMSANAKGHSQRPIANSRPIEVSAMKDNTGTIARYHCTNSTRNSETASTSSRFVRHRTCHMKNIAVQTPQAMLRMKKGAQCPSLNLAASAN